MSDVSNPKLKQLAEIEGFNNVMAMLEEASTDSVVRGICTTKGCDYTCDVEPDSESGWCELCNKGTVKSCLVLGGII